MGLILMPLYRPLVGLFNPPPEIVNDLFVVLLINTLVQVPLWSISFILPSARVRQATRVYLDHFDADHVAVPGDSRLYYGDCSGLEHSRRMAGHEL